MLMDYQLQPPSCLVMGSPGSGKTDALATLIEAGLETFVLVTEPDGIGSLIDSIQRRKLDINMLHWSVCQPAAQGWESLKSLADTVGRFTFEELKGEKSSKGKEFTRGPGMKIITSLANFHCDRTNRDYGPIDKFNANRAIVLDSLTGLNMIAFMLSVGHKSNPHQGEWGVAMNFVEQVILKLTSDRSCYLVVTGHLERETDEIEGRTITTISTLGKKLAPRLTRFFSDIVLARRKIEDGKAKFTWSTIDPFAELKNRNLPLDTNLTQSFVPIVRSYSRRLEAAGLTPPPAAPDEPVPAAPTLTPHLTKQK
jgi:hypothetical protein